MGLPRCELLLGTCSSVEFDVVVGEAVVVGWGICIGWRYSEMSFPSSLCACLLGVIVCGLDHVNALPCFVRLLVVIAFFV